MRGCGARLAPLSLPRLPLRTRTCVMWLLPAANLSKLQEEPLNKCGVQQAPTSIRQQGRRAEDLEAMDGLGAALGIRVALSGARDALSGKRSQPTSLECRKGRPHTYTHTGRTRTHTQAAHMAEHACGAAPHGRRVGRETRRSMHARPRPHPLNPQSARARACCM